MGPLFFQRRNNMKDNENTNVNVKVNLGSILLFIGWSVFAYKAGKKSGYSEALKDVVKIVSVEDDSQK